MNSKQPCWKGKPIITKVRRVDGGGLTPINEYVFGEKLSFYPQTKRIGFPISGFSIRCDGPYQDMYGFRFYSPGGIVFTGSDLMHCKGKGKIYEDCSYW